MALMAFRITDIRTACPKGTCLVKQLAVASAGDRNAWFVALWVQCGHTTFRGELRFTSEALDRVRGVDDEARAQAVAAALQQWLDVFRLSPDFVLKMDVDRDGIQFFDAAPDGDGTITSA